MNKEQHAFDRLVHLGAVLSGTPCSPVLILKGNLTQVDATGGLLSGADGDALRKSLSALKYEPQDWTGLSTHSPQGEPIAFDLLKEAVVVASPSVIIICDNAAQEVFRNAFASELAAIPDLDDALLSPGNLVRLLGMRVMNLGGFEESLSDDSQKRVMWARLKQLAPESFL